MARARAVDGALKRSPGPRVRRRAVIAAASGLVAAALAKSGQPAEAQAAADVGDFLLGVRNTAAATTELDRTGGGTEPALTVRKKKKDGGITLTGQASENVSLSERGIGVVGKLGSPELTFDGDYYLTLNAAVLGFAQLPAPIQLGPEFNVTATAGVIGDSRGGGGLLAIAPAEAGLLGIAGPGATYDNALLTLASGVGQGLSEAISFNLAGASMQYAGQAGVIVRRRRKGGANAEPAAVAGGDGLLRIAGNRGSFGVDAIHTGNGVALGVDGRARFSTCGRGVIRSTAGQQAAQFFVANPAVRRQSHVTVTLLHPPDPCYVAWIELAPKKGFTTHLNQAPVVEALPFSYLIVESEPALLP